MHSIADIFGVDSNTLARADAADPTTPLRTYATAVDSPTMESPGNPARALLDPKNSAIFWLGLFAVLGLVLVSGQIKVDAALGGRAGR